MAMDVKKYRKKLKDNNPRFNMVPFIDILFTLLIFVIVTSSFQVADQSATSGKPEQIESSGPSEYYQIPVAGLKKVTVNGVDMSKYIRNNAIAVHTRVIDEGEIVIKPKQGLIIITAPSDMALEKAVKAPT